MFCALRGCAYLQSDVWVFGYERGEERVEHSAAVHPQQRAQGMWGRFFAAACGAPHSNASIMRGKVPSYDMTLQGAFFISLNA